MCVCVGGGGGGGGGGFYEYGVEARRTMVQCEEALDLAAVSEGVYGVVRAVVAEQCGHVTLACENNKRGPVSI